jgi:HAE1 family hydrophobic/amphiphilic exporter-1
MWRLSQLALRSRVITLVVVVILLGASIWALLGMKMEMIPDIEFPYTTVITVYPQALPETVADEVTTPIEEAIWDRWEGKGIKHLYSTSAENISAILAEFEFGTNMEEATASIKEGIGELPFPPAVLELPQTNPEIGENPRVIPINMSMMPLVVLSLGGDMSPDQLKELANTQIVPALKSVDGVLNVEIEGGDNDQVVVAPSAEEMVEYGISMSQIIGLLASQYDSLDAIENASMGVDSVVLKDIADVGQGPPPSSVVTRTNGKPSLGILVMKEDEANTVDVANALAAKVEELKTGLASGVELFPVFDQSDFIESSINELWEKALVGGALAIVIVFLFLMAVRASLVTAISIPLSILTGFLVMRAFGITINLLTLSAMSIAVGRLIDDSIVMVEVIYRRLQRGENFRDAAISGSKEIAMPITSATLATVAIFIPLIFVGGIVGEMFVPFALTITFAMLASLFVAIMVVPALSNFLVSGKAKTEIRESWYQKLYVPSLKWALHHRALTLIIAAVLFIGSLALVPVIGTSFMPSMTEKMVMVDISMPPGTDIGKTNEIAAEVEALLEGNEAIKSYDTTVGVSTSLYGAMTAASGGGDNTATITVYLKPDADMDKEAEILRHGSEGLAGGNVGIVVTTSEHSSQSGMSFSDLEVSIQGENLETLATTTLQLYDELKELEGISNLASELSMVVPELNIEIDMGKVAALGITTEQLEQLQQEFYILMLGSNIPGKTANIDGESYGVFIKGVADGLHYDVALAESLRIGYPQSLALGDIADVELLERQTHISHTDLSLSATIRGAITADDVGSVNIEVQNKIDAMQVPPGVEIKIAGAAEMMTETFSRMGIAIIAAIVISLLLLVVTMRSILNPFIILVSLPLASIGALLGLLAGGHTMGVSAMMGMLMLVGIVLTNAIVLIALVEQLRKSGMNTYDALVQGGSTRLRPILMTALTTIFAMIPLAFGVGEGTLLAAELAVVVVGGLFSSTLLTLLVIPVVYSLVDGLRHRKAKTT